MSKTTPLTIASVFGDKRDIAERMKNFDFSKLDSTNKSSEAFITEKLAPSFGSLTASSFRFMDDHLKIMILATTKIISQIPIKDRSWDNVISALKTNSLIEPIEGSEIFKTADPFTKSSTNVFKVDGSPDDAIVKEVAQWFDRFIADQDILKSTAININTMGKIVAQTGATIDSFETFFGKNQYEEKNVLDIGVLRYPDIDHPYFKVYRIELKAWSQSKRVLFIQEDTNGITGQFHCYKFKPRQSTMDGLKAETKEKAVQEAEDLFSFIKPDTKKKAVMEAESLLA